jgi:DNA-binding NtrC family response regulator
MTLKVLIVDDSPAIRLVLRRAVIRMGVPEDHVFDTEDAMGAMRIFQRYHPEVVFMDLTLKPRVRLVSVAERDDPTPPLIPETFEAGEILAKQMLYRSPTVRLIVCTGAHPASASVREVVKYGAFDVLEKPITLEKVQHVFQNLAAEGLTISSSGPYRAEDPVDSRTSDRSRDDAS